MVKVSILMAAKNQEDYIEESIESVKNQTLSDWELIIIDDCSTDKTKEIAEKYSLEDERIKLIILKENKGFKSKALNEGIKIAKGDYIGILDADDIYEKDKLKFQVEYLEKNRGIDFVYGVAELFGEVNRLTKILDLKEDPRALLIKKSEEDLSKLSVGEFFGLRGSVPSCSVLFRKKILKDCKFDENFPRSQDYDFLFQVIGKGYKIKGINKIFYKYRIHKNNSVKNKESMDLSRDYILNKLKKKEYFK